MILVSISSLRSQVIPFSKHYNHNINSGTNEIFDLDGSYVLEKFFPTNQYPFEGTVMFQPIRHTNAPGSVKLQLSLLDQDGVVVVSRTIGLPLALGNRDMVPISSASNSYINPNTGQTERFYIVTGVTRSITAQQLTRYDTWYLILDQNVANFYLGTYRTISSVLSGATPTSTFTTDVCAVETKNGIAFALTGMYLAGGNNPDPVGSSATPRTMFIAEINENGVVVNDQEYQTWDFSNSLQVDNLFVNRIIELPSNLAPNDGYVIGGSMRGNTLAPLAFFYLRVDNGLTNLSFSIKEDINSLSYLAIGDLLYDANNDEVRIIGTSTNLDANSHAYFADKMVNVSSPGINLYSDSWNGVPDIMGIFSLPPSDLEGYPKIGSLNPEYDTRNTVTGSLREGGTFNGTLFTPVLFDVRYDDVSLDNWTTNQAPDIFTYYRIFGSNPGTNYYNALNYNQPWFPDHCSHLYDYTTQQYLLGGLTHDPNLIFPDDYPVLNLTDNQYFNECMFEPKAFTPMLTQLTPIGNISIFDFDPAFSATNFHQWIYYTWFNDNVEVDCITQQNFKSNLVSVSTELYTLGTSGLYEIGNKETIISKIEILNIHGQTLLCSSPKDAKVKIDISSYPKGLYFLKASMADGKHEIYKLYN
ncbi:MAG: T9SS type A sorting domain-containing protein [Chitinophagaceae bacterium]